MGSVGFVAAFFGAVWTDAAARREGFATVGAEAAGRGYEIAGRVVAVGDGEGGVAVDAGDDGSLEIAAAMAFEDDAGLQVASEAQVVLVVSAVVVEDGGKLGCGLGIGVSGRVEVDDGQAWRGTTMPVDDGWAAGAADSAAFVVVFLGEIGVAATFKAGDTDADGTFKQFVEVGFRLFRHRPHGVLLLLVPVILRALARGSPGVMAWVPLRVCGPF